MNNIFKALIITAPAVAILSFLCGHKAIRTSSILGAGVRKV